MPTSFPFNLIFWALIFVRSTMACISYSQRSLLRPSPPPHLCGMFVFKTKEPSASVGITYQNVFPAEIKNTQTSLFKARYYLLLIRNDPRFVHLTPQQAPLSQSGRSRAQRHAVCL